MASGTCLLGSHHGGNTERLNDSKSMDLVSMGEGLQVFHLWLLKGACIAIQGKFPLLNEWKNVVRQTVSVLLHHCLSRVNVTHQIKTLYSIQVFEYKFKLKDKLVFKKSLPIELNTMSKPPFLQTQ